MALNSLPDYKIRTMKDDLAKLAGKSEEDIRPMKKVAPPEKLPIAPKPFRASLPSTEELITKAPIPKTKKVELPEVPKPRTKLAEPAKIKKPKTKLLIILIIILLIVGGAGGFLYWYGKEKPESPPAEEEYQPEIPQPSEYLIPAEETKIISLGTNSLFELLKQEAQLDQPVNSFKRIAVLTDSPTGEEKGFLSLSEIFQELEINYPPYLLPQLKENYNIFLFNQETGKRLLLIVETGNIDNLREQLTIWEETMLEDFKNFYPIDKPGQPASEDFLDDIYRDTAIRYTNLPFSTLTINYTIINNLLIIGTSKEAIYTAIDSVLD